MRNSKSQRRTSHKHSNGKLAIKDSPILGITFKSKQFDRKQKTQFVQAISEGDGPLDQFKGDVRKKVKYWKQKRQWDRVRGMNVDSIVNRTCRTFEELIKQYTRRMGLSQNVKIFVFESKDGWMRRVLIDRGWVQNTNTSSRVFHLNWSNKLYKQPLFEGQCINHYANCYSIATKGGLHTLLKKYKLSYLQPVTFDIPVEKDRFMCYYLRSSFVGEIRNFLDRFQFEDQPFQVSKDSLVKQIDDVISGKGGDWQMDELHRKIIKLFKYCKILLQGEFSHKQIMFINFNQIYHLLKGKQELH